MNLKYFGIAALLGLAGVWIFQRDSLRVRATEPRTLTASFYGAECAGKTMANGRVFDPAKFTCASWDYALGTMLRISANGKTIACVVTDRGPHKRLLRTRQIDLSRATFRALAPLKLGLIEVTVSTIEHIIPRSAGGSNAPENLGLACRPCNNGHVGQKL